VVGLSEALAAGVPLPGAFLIGVITGVGGGVIRDLLVGEVPVIFQAGQYYALLVALASALYLALVLPFGVAPSLAAWTAIGVAFVLRLLTLRYDWRTIPAAELGTRIARGVKRWRGSREP
ncbi:MAG: TRIC cation channel family protein, partial [Myxococcota bacterium]